MAISAKRTAHAASRKTRVCQRPFLAKSARAARPRSDRAYTKMLTVAGRGVTGTTRLSRWLDARAPAGHAAASRWVFQGELGMVARLLRCASLCACVISVCVPASAGAEASRWVLRSALDAAAMLSRDQVGRLGYDQVGLLGATHVGLSAAASVDLTLGVMGGAFLSSSDRSGGLAASTVGLLFHGPRDALAPYASVEAGPGVTGTLVRPFLRLAVGLDLPVSTRLMMGPAAGYAQLLHTHGPRDSTDARYLWLGISLLYRHVEKPVVAPKERVVLVIDHTRETARVVEQEAQDPPDLTVLLEQALPASRVELLAPVLFAFDSDLLEPVGVAMLHEVARELRDRPDIRLVSIQGYADSRGSAEYNQALSQKRAARVLVWLVEHGIAQERLQIAAEGASAPVEPGTSEPAYQQNRRVVFRVLKADPP